MLVHWGYIKYRSNCNLMIIFFENNKNYKKRKEKGN